MILAAGDCASRLDACGPQPQYIDSEPLAICSTTRHTAIMDLTDCAAGSTFLRLRLEVFAPGGGPIAKDHTSTPELQRDGALDQRASDDTHWIYRFPEVGAADVTLAFTTGAAPTATLTIGYDAEPCFAFVP